MTRSSKSLHDASAGRHEEAEVALRQYAEIAPGDVVNLYLLGESLLALGRRDEAVAILEAVLERQPGFRHAKARLVQLEIQDQARAEAASSTPAESGAVE